MHLMFKLYMCTIIHLKIKHRFYFSFCFKKKLNAGEITNLQGIDQLRRSNYI